MSDQRWDPLRDVPMEHVTRFISKTTDGYWFWDETQTAAFGPFADLEDCKWELNQYVGHLNGN